MKQQPTPSSSERKEARCSSVRASGGYLLYYNIVAIAEAT